MIIGVQTFDLAVGYKVRNSRSVVLDGLNLSARAGEMVCLLGTNGTGKSTLLRTLARLQPALSGSVKIGGADIRQLSQMELARRLGVVLTERAMVGALTARRIVELGRYPYWDWSGRMTHTDHEVVAWAIEAVGAVHLASRDIMSLSDGERQRFMIARALAQEPSILLLDEPTAFLDVPSRVELMGLLRRLARDEQLAIVVSTHDIELALRMADTLWLISPGNRLTAGTPEDVILSGNVAEAFQTESIRFQPEERTFSLVTDARGSAVVRGDGLNAVLAAAVLEREGFQIVKHAADALTVRVEHGSTSWELTTGHSHHSGTGFATLAELARGLTIAPRNSDTGNPRSISESSELKT
jgi:iron complex transport system ATP-binding protein